MTRIDFAKIMAYVGCAVGKTLTAADAEVYFDLLGELPVEVLRVAAKRVVLEHRWATFPTIAELREAATLTQQGEVTGICAAEAWQLAWRARANIDPDIHGSIDRHTKDLPPRVLEAMRVFGMMSFCASKEPIAVLRAQFTKVYEQLATRDKRLDLFPAALQRDIERIGTTEKPPAISGSVGAALAKIGAMPA